MLEVIPGAKPLESNLTQYGLAQPALPERSGDAKVGVDIAALVVDGQLDAGSIGRRDEAITGCNGDVHRLGGDHVLARFNGLNPDLRVKPTGGHHQHRVHIVAAEHLPQIRGPMAPQFLTYLSRQLSVQVNHRHQLGATCLAHQPGPAPPHAQPHHGKSHHALTLPSEFGPSGTGRCSRETSPALPSAALESPRNDGPPAPR